MTDCYLVAGNPVQHSQSPWIHEQFAKQTGIHLRYERLLCPLDDFEAFLKTHVAHAPADAPIKGANITVPFKAQAFAMAIHTTPRAGLAQAANTLRFDAQGWCADNTDGAGLVRDIEYNANFPLVGQNILMIGAGGASAGALGALIAARPNSLSLVNRTSDKAIALMQRHQAWAEQHQVQVQAGGLDTALGQNYDVVINASASSLQGASIPVPSTVLKPGALALDMMYGPAAQPFLQWADAQGARSRDGLGMLVEQAAQAFFFWHGVRPETASVLTGLRQRFR
jgi:shikimate dehydrogenase